MDPAIAYDTGSYEPILNVYQTLVNYNGSSTSTFVPTLATCVPGTEQCVHDYGTNLTTYEHGQPIYWTFVIDPAAHFYDPHTGVSWSVYPSDVMFSISRTLAFANLPYPTKNPGWIIGQSLLPTPTALGAAWDGGIHAGFPGYDFNNTPGNILGSMLVNDTNYCPQVGGHFVGNGCITFRANGGGHDWPFFLELVEDNLGASIVPCGWYTYQDAGIPGWHGTNSTAGPGDGPCKLPNGGTSTQTPGWASYVAKLNSTAPGAMNATYWDTFEELAITSPQVQTGVEWSMVGSGPYYGSPSRGIGYQLRVNPAYQQPSGCSGAGGLATYPDSYCDPAVGGYIGSVNVNWDPDDSYGISECRAGTADFCAIASTDTPTLLQLVSEGKLNYFTSPTISDFFTPINLNYNKANFISEFPTEAVPTIPQTFFQNYALREFLVHSYPYATVEQTVRTVDGIQFDFNTGGPIPYGMNPYYPTNVSFPIGNPSFAAGNVSGAEWWWSQATNPHSEYYDSATAACTVATPCTWPITGLIGDPGDDIAIGDWINDISALTGGRLVPFTFDVTFDTVLDDFLVSAAQNPVVSFVGTGWAPDYPDPTDYVAPEVQPESSYTEPDQFAEQLGWGTNMAANNTTCGHNAYTFQDLAYWAHQASNAVGSALNETCQGVAYNVASSFMTSAALLPVGTERTLDYNLIEHITNALSMVIWNGQANAVLSAAPWIDLNSINTNVVIGGGGDAVFFQVRYVPWESQTTFTEKGLPTGTAWKVSAGVPSVPKGNTTVGTKGVVSYEEPNGTVSFSISAPAGYGVAKVTGPATAHVSYNSYTATGAPTALTVTFGALVNVYLNESISAPSWPGLPTGTTWSVTFTQTTGGPAGMVLTNTTTVAGGSIHLTLAKGTKYTYTTQKPSTYKDSGAKKGTLSVGAHTVKKLIKFAPDASKVTFSEHGLASHTTWSVAITGVAGSPFSSSSSSIKVSLVNGSYTYSIPNVGAAVASPAGGGLTIVAPVAQTVHVTFTPEHAFGSSAVTQLAGTLFQHTELIATVTGREAA